MNDSLGYYAHLAFTGGLRYAFLTDEVTATVVAEPERTLGTAYWFDTDFGEYGNITDGWEHVEGPF